MAALCGRYGPSRLPGADRQAIGGGYAMATTAAVSAVVWALAGQIPGIGEATAIGPFWFGYLGIPAGMHAVVNAAVAMPLVVPSAFVAGAAMWLPGTSDLSISSRMAGLLAAVLTYLIATAVLAPVIVLFRLFQNPVLLSSEFFKILSGAPMVAIYAGVYVFVLTFWLTLPLGALGGHIHDAARAAR